MSKHIKFVLLILLLGISLASEKTSLLNYLPQRDINNQAILYDKKVYLLDIWATWCPPCRMTVPELVKLQQNYVSQNIMIIGLSVDRDDPETVRKFMRDNKINYPVAMAEQTLNYLPSIQGIPTMFLLDKNGKIINRFVGYTDQATLAKAVDSALKNNN